MWMMTTRGFFSAVQKRGSTDITIRARAEGDLERLAELIPGLKVREGGGTDYPFRATCSHGEWAQAVARMAVEVDYSNFKDEVKRVGLKDHASVYMKVWSALLSLEPTRWKSKFSSVGKGGHSVTCACGAWTLSSPCPYCEQPDQLPLSTITKPKPKAKPRARAKAKTPARVAAGKRGRGRQS